jgi:hypothetical protein
MEFRLPVNPVVVRSKESGKEYTVAVIPGSYQQVRFDGHPSTFLMAYSACENPKCECTNVIVTFFEEGSDGKPQSHRLQFGVELDINTWKVGQLYDANPTSNPLIREFVSSMAGDLKDNIRIKYRTFRQAVATEAQFRVSAAAVRKGHMACAEEVFGLSKEPDGCALTLPLMAEHKGSLFRIHDFYCMNPSCRCGEAHLSVVQVDKKADHAARTEALFTARLRFEGKIGLSDISGTIPRPDAVELLSEWLRRHPAVVVEIEERNRRIKAVGKRLLKRRNRR